jgi:MFS family permease
VLAAASVVVTLALVRAPASEAGYRSEPVLATLRSARRDRFVLAGCAVMVLIGLLNGGINLLAPLELNRAGLSAGETGLVFSAASGIFVLVSARVTRFGRRAVTGAHGADLGRGAIMGLLNLVWGAASAVGPLAAGGPAQSLGERWVYALLFAWCTATGIWLVAAPEPVRAADHQ